MYIFLCVNIFSPLHLYGNGPLKVINSMVRYNTSDLPSKGILSTFKHSTPEGWKGRVTNG